MGLIFILEVNIPKKAVFFVYVDRDLLSETGCFKRAKTSLMFLVMSEVTVFLVLLLVGQSLVLSAIWVREWYSSG